MANTKISAMTAATVPLAGTEVLPLVQSGNNVKVSAADITAGRAISALSYAATGASAPLDGVYLPSANTVGISTDSTLRVSITTGAVVSTLPVSNALGSVSAPAYSFTGDLNTGMYSSAADVLDFATGGSRVLQLQNNGTDVNYVRMLSNSTGNSPFVLSGGSDSNISLIISSKGTGGIRLATNSNGQLQLQVLHVASAVNNLQAAGAITGSGPELSAQGSDTDIDLRLTPKGAGVLRFGSATASAATPSTHKIQIKAADGTTYYLLATT